MFILKFFLVVLLLFFVLFIIGAGAVARTFSGLLSGLRPGMERRGQPASRSGRFGNEGEAKKAERMLPCAVCGVHVPESEGIKSAGRFFCCEAHRK